MSRALFVNHAPAAAGVWHVTPANVETDDVFEITLSNHAGEQSTISFTATAATVQNVVEGLQAAAAAATTAGDDPWDEVTVTEDDSKVIITADSTGTPFWVTTSTTDGGGADTQTLTVSQNTSWGDGDVDNADNWSGGSGTGGVPATGDDVVIPSYVTGTMYGGDLTGVNINSFTREDGGVLGVGSLAHPLQITLQSQTDRTVDLAGTAAVYLDVDYAAAVTRSSDHACYLRGVNNTALHSVPGGGSTVCEVGDPDGATCEFDTISHAPGSTGTLRVLYGVVQDDGSSAVTLNQSGGRVETWTPVGTVDRTGGDWVHYRGDVTTLRDTSGGTIYGRADCTVTTMTLGPGTRLDLSNNTDGWAATTAYYVGDCELLDPNDVYTATTENWRQINGASALMRRGAPLTS